MSDYILINAAGECMKLSSNPGGEPFAIPCEIDEASRYESCDKAENAASFIQGVALYPIPE